MKQTFLFLLSFILLFNACMNVPEDYTVKYMEHYITTVPTFDTVLYPDFEGLKVYDKDTLFFSDIMTSIISIDTIYVEKYDTIWMSDSIIGIKLDTIIIKDTTYKNDSLYNKNSIDYMYSSLDEDLVVRSDVDNEIDGFILLDAGDSIALQVNQISQDYDHNYTYIYRTFKNDLSIFDSERELFYYRSTSDPFINVKALRPSKGMLVFEDWRDNRLFSLSYCISPLDSIVLHVDSINLGYYQDIKDDDTTKAYNWIQLAGYSNAYSMTVMLGVNGYDDFNYKPLDRTTIVNPNSSKSPLDFKFRLAEDLKPNELSKAIKNIRIVLRGTLGFDRIVEIPLPN